MQISIQVNNFQTIELPEQNCYLVGYSALINAFQLETPFPLTLAAISRQHKKYITEKWLIFTPRYQPPDTVAGHLTFALRYEGVDLAVLQALFQKVSPEDLISWIESEPIGQYSRRIWFLYEWLTDIKLPIADAITGNFVNVIDETQQFGGPIKISKRHRVRNNLPGVKDFCPLIRKTEKLKKFIDLKLDTVAIEKAKVVPRDVINRAASFLLLQDSCASFEIEKERPSHNRIERWGKVIGEAGFQ